MQRFIKSKWAKVIAVHLIFVFVFEMVRPLELYALTSGPGQPEFEGFTEVDMSQSVDPFTGDFTYQIALMTVPGPNGGYPLNLVYNSGVGMEDEAGWVGLGWNLNPGAINRSVRGLPDDFSGPATDIPANEADFVKKTQYMKPNITIGFGVSTTFGLPEIYNIDTEFGEELSASAGITPSLKLYYNSYTGPGYTLGLSASVTNNMGSFGNLQAGAALNFDSNDGPSVNPNVSYGVGFGRFNASTSFGMGYSSRQGVTGMNFSLNTGYAVSKQYHPKVSTNESGMSFQGPGLRLSYAAASGIPSVSTPMQGFNAGFQLDLQFGPTGVHPKTPIGFEGFFNTNETADYIREGYNYPAYGTLYSQKRYAGVGIEDNRALMDYELEKNIPVNKKVPMLPLPVMSHDIYSVNGSDMGGTFRAYRNDAGVFYDAKAVSDFIGVNIGVEFATATGIKFGVDPTVSYTNSYSGKWQDGDEPIMNLMGFKDFAMPTTSGTLQKNEPFFFRLSDELGVEPDGFNGMQNKGGPGPASFSINGGLSQYPGYSDVQGQSDDTDALEQMESENIFEGQNSMTTEITPILGGTAYSASSFVNNEPPVRNTLIAYKTKREKTLLGDPSVSNFYAPSGMTDVYGNPVATSTFNTNWFVAEANGSLKNHHMAEFTMINSTGMKYVYATPLYNTQQQEVFFSIENMGGLPYQANTTAPDRIKTFAGLNAVLASGKGSQSSLDHAFTRNVTGAYAHSHLLTFIASPDYVDVDNNGPSENDMGYWTKFNYYKPSTFRWRMPVGNNTVNYSTGYASSPRDDKASVTYGEKQLQYIHSVETKTHIAIFTLKPRWDALGVTGIGGAIDANNKQKYVESIQLYAKSDMQNPIKTVHFVYELPGSSLCQKVTNAVNAPNEGKLTLKEIYFTYQNSSKGEKVKYAFEYGDRFTEDNNGFLQSAEQVNLDYDAMMTDRWGNYGSVGNEDPESPYTDQKRDGTSELNRKRRAVNWNLTQIHLPTGSTVRVDYESDDYAHVQDQKASQMLRITGTGTGNPADGINWLASGNAPITEHFQCIYFEPLEPINPSLSSTEIMNEVGKYAAGLHDDLVYFKAWEKLQVPKNEFNWAYDYVNGYARVKRYGYTIESGVVHPYLELEKPNDDSKHYFRTAGFQYLRYSRTDLSNSSPDNPDPIFLITMIFDVIMQSIELMSGYYNYSIMKGNCREIGPLRPSYLRLYTPDGVKYGGGTRVRKLTVSDSWMGSSEYQYGTDYYYTQDDGKSSGVATYEPMLGNEENTMKRPHMYGPDNQFSNNNDAFFQEEPFGENFFPAPSVGYGKVTMVNIVNNRQNVDPGKEVTKSAGGVQVKTFYTARDFPIITQSNPVDQVDKSLNIPIPIVGSISLESKGYSQGYYIELNDMHGKPKEEFTYDADFWDKDTKKMLVGAPFVGKRQCKYFTDNEYMEGVPGHLNNTIPVLNAAGQEITREIGIQSEIYSHVAEDKTYTISGGANVGGGVDPLPFAFFIMVTPSISYGESAARVVTTTKVTTRKGLLKEVFNYANGTTVITKNLLFDAETGTPVLTAVTDDYDNPNTPTNDRLIYTQDYPAYWYYQGMGPAYRNYRYRFYGNPASCPNADKYFVKGDEVLVNGTTKAWIKTVSPTGFVLMNQAGAAGPTGTMSIALYRSGYRNEQSAMSGKIVSLIKPQENFSSLLQEMVNDYNTFVYGAGTAPYNTNIFNVTGQQVTFSRSVRMCNGAEYDISFRFTGCPTGAPSCTTLTLVLQIDNKPGSPEYHCTRNHSLQKTSPWTAMQPSLLHMTYVQNPVVPGQHWQLQYGSGPLENLNPLGDLCPDIQKKCMDGILHAETTEFDDDWDYKGEFKTATTFWANNNDYLTGKKGIWRMKRANTYFTEREQWGIHHVNDFGATSLRRDGTYKIFVPFDYKLDALSDGVMDGNTDNAQAFDGWRWAAEVPRYGYNPYGFEIENRDALGIYSSALYGYANSVATGVAKNAAYAEIGFDGFEEYPATYDESTTQTYVPHGHLDFHGSNMGITSRYSHTGVYSLYSTNSGAALLAALANDQQSFNQNYAHLQLVKNKKYSISFWCRTDDDDALSVPWAVFLLGGNTPSTVTNIVSTYALSPGPTPAIDGWRRYEFVLDVSVFNPYAYAAFSLVGVNTLYLDDVRIFPFDGNMATYVYDQRQLKLSAQLDENNYATFYNYDEEGNLVQVKKETERGIMTVQQTRKNVNQ